MHKKPKIKYMTKPNLANLTRQYQQAYLVYCFKIMQYLQALAWLETQKTPPKQPGNKLNNATYSQKRTSGFNFFKLNPHQQKLNFKSLKYLENYDVKNKVASMLLVYTHDIAGRTETIKDRNGNASVFVYDNAGSVIAETNALGETTFHEYNNYRLETKRIDPLGNETNWTYDNFGNQLTETDALGNTTTVTVNRKGKILTQTDAQGNVTITNEYVPDYNPAFPSSPQHGYGQLKKITDALGNITEFHWTSGVTNPSPSGKSVTASTGYTDAGGNFYGISPIVNGLNSGLSGHTIDMNGLKVTTTFNDEAQAISESSFLTDDNGNVIKELIRTFEYNSNGKVIKVVNSNGGITRTEYNEINKISASIDARGNRIEYKYNSLGNLFKVIYPDGTSELNIFDANNNIVEKVDKLNRKTKFEFDAVNRNIITLLPDNTPNDDSDNPRIINEYDAAGRKVSATDANGNTSVNTYDASGKPFKSTDALGNETIFVYDSIGNNSQVIDSLGRVTKNEFNDAGNVIKTIFPDSTPNDDNDNFHTAIVYNSLSQKISETDLAGNTTNYEYDAEGKLITVIDSLLQRTEYSYDQRGNKVSQIDANNNETTWEYNELNRLEGKTLPNGENSSFAYDLFGNRISKTDFNGDSTIYTYNNLNQLILTTYADSTTVVYTYTVMGLVASMIDVEGLTSYQYDANDRLTRLDYPDGNFISYQYDLNGNRTQVQTANQTVEYTFDALNRSQTVTDTSGITTYGYDNVGNRNTQTNANGTIATYQYDNLNRLIDLTHTDSSSTVIASYAYTLGANGNRLSIEEATGRIVDYTYDDLYRLTSETITDAINGDHYNEFAYDAVGNRLQQFKDGVITIYSYNNNDQIQSETENTVVTSYAYDNNGNTISKSIDGMLDTSYSYNKDNRMVQAITPTSIIINTYDADGIRQSQTVDGITTNYLVDQNRSYAQVLEEQNNLFIPQTTYVYGDDLINQTQSGVTHTFGYDGLGSTRILTDLTGTVQNSYGYEAFGEKDYQFGTVPNSYLFTGEQYDNNVGFYYLRARFYNPTNGRFTQMDTFSGMQFEPVTLHKYLYANANPSNMIDPSGNISLVQIGVTLAVGAIVNSSIGVGLNMLNPTVDNIWGDLLRDATIGALTAPVGGLLGRVFAPVLKGMASPVMRAVQRLTLPTLVGKSKWKKVLINMSRVFVTKNKTYPKVSSTIIGRTLIKLFPQFKWQQHHIFIQQAWFRTNGANQLYTNLAENIGLRRLGNAGWNLMPIPAKLNGFLGRSEVATQVFATFIYSVAVFGPTRLAMMVNDVVEAE